MNRLKQVGLLFAIVMLLCPTISATEPTQEEINLNMAERYNIEEDIYTYIGEFTITHYCSCKLCNGRWTNMPAANGEKLIEGYTIAVDPKVIPLNSWVKIGDVTYKACDTGSAIKGNKIDIFVDDHDKCYELGKVKNVDVYIKEMNKYE